MKKIFLLILTSLVFLAGCSKNEENLVPDDETPEVLKFITRDSPIGTIGMLDGVEGIVVELPAVKEGDGDSDWKADQDYPAKKVVIAINNIGGDWQLYEMYAADQDKTVWRIPHIEELCGLYNMKDVTWTENGCRWAIGNSSLFLCGGQYISDKYDFDFYEASEFLYGLGFNTNIKRAYFGRYFFSYSPYLRLFHDMPQ